MGNIAAAAVNAAPDRAGNPLDWLMIYSIEHSGGITDDWLKKSGLNRSAAQKLLNENPEMQKQARKLQRVGRLFNLEMMFALLRQRAAEMLAAATKPAEIRSLLGTLDTLRGGEIREAKEQARLAAKSQADVPAVNGRQGR